MAQSLVSDKALIREMDASELEEYYNQKWRKWDILPTESPHAYWFGLPFVDEIKRQYKQLTGKTLN